ncbi:MAG: NADPH-dependent F420 reductase [Solirubrobacteraceae bacterium]
MRIGVIGSGRIGGTAAALLAARGHEVVIANSRGPESLADLAAEAGVTPGTVEEAARHGDVVLVAIPFGRIGELPPEPFAGKIVVDANNYYPGRDGHMEALDRDETTSSELLARHLPGTRVDKAFNTMNYVPFGERGDPAAPIDERLALYVAGDDADAKAVVSGLIEDLGFAAVDAGGLADGGRRLQPGSPVYAADLTAAQAAEHLRR